MSDLRQQRRALGLTRTRVAVEAGCSVTMLQMLEDGYRPSRSVVLPRVMAVLDCHKNNERVVSALVDKEDDSASASTP